MKSDGSIWAWGFNAQGQLGDGTSTNSNSPVQIGTDNNWVSIAAGYNHSHGLRSDGTLWSWGRNNLGQLGDGTIIGKNSPEKTGTDNIWISIAAGNHHNLALKSDGSLWVWGYNAQWQLGDGTVTTQTNPIHIGTDNDWISIAAGTAQSLALKSGGSLFAWGKNSSGELGNGSYTAVTTPVQIGADNNWVRVIAGNHHSIGLRSERVQFCATGSNLLGQLGDNTIIDKNAFTCNTNTVVLPVTFISISANRTSAGIQVNWKVAAESNISHYQVERSTDGSNFVITGTVNAINSSTDHTYNWTDLYAPSGPIFYRIKSVGLSGEVKYTNTVKLTSGNGRQGIIVSPNPIENGTVNLQFKSQPPGKYTVRLIGTNGQSIFTSVADHAGGNSTQLLHLPVSIATGTYRIEIISPDKTRVTQTVFVNKQ